MFSIEFLHEIRRAELDAVAPWLPAGARILEIGGGTGFQAKLLAERGFAVDCLDVAASSYARERVYPVREFDGVTLPFANGTFDIVFSSNALEHVARLDALHAEIRRVLVPEGSCLHILPSGSWRFWSLVTHYPSLPFLLLARTRGEGPGGGGAEGRRGLRHLLARALWPGRHGETGNTLAEIYLFSRWRWRSEFRRQGFEVRELVPLGVFYTGNLLFGASLPPGPRHRLARLLGSSSILYRLTPGARSPSTNP